MLTTCTRSLLAAVIVVTSVWTASPAAADLGNVKSEPASVTALSFNGTTFVTVCWEFTVQVLNGQTFDYTGGRADMTIMFEDGTTFQDTVSTSLVVSPGITKVAICANFELPAGSDVTNATATVSLERDDPTTETDPTNEFKAGGGDTYDCGRTDSPVPVEQ